MEADIEIGEPSAVCTLRAHRGEVACADARGAWLATGGGDGALRLWRWRRAAGWLEVADDPRAHRYGVTAARWAPTGVLLASVGVDGVARVWASRTLAPRLALAAPHAAAARSACWATGERLLVGHDDGAVRAWRLPAGVLLACVRAHEGALHGVATLGDATLLLTACTQGVLKIFDLEEVCSSGTEGGGEGPAPLVWEDGAHDLGALCADTSACGRAAATGGRDARIRVWRWEGARGVRGVRAAGTLGGYGGAVTAVRWARGAALLVSASLDRTARVWAVAAGACVRVLPAHARYLTCVVVPDHARYVITGCSDRTVRTWSLSDFSLQDDVEPACSPLLHFGLGDLAGIGPVDEPPAPADEDAACGAEAGAQCLWRSRDAHGGAVNGVATHGALLATACSDGAVRVFRWDGEAGALRLERALAGHRYPVLAVDFGADGALLLSAGLDGRACLWDVQTGCELASLWAGGAEGEGGGGGVRAARVSGQRPPLLLLGTDAGTAALWTLEYVDSDPMHVFRQADAGAACTCVAWAAGGAAAAAGGAGGALRLLAPPPQLTELWRHPDAHDLGVLSCDFAPDEDEAEGKGEGEVQRLLLASGGMDELVKLWAVELRGGPAAGGAHVEQACALAAHGAAVQSVRWGAGGALATAGADRWARVWRVAHEGRHLRAVQVAAVPAGGAGGAPAAAFLCDSLLAVGAQSGCLAVWRLPAAAAEVPAIEDDGVEPRWWREAGVLRWLRDYVTPVAAAGAAAEGARLAAAVRAHGLTGARLLDEPLGQLLQYFGYETDAEPSVGGAEGDGGARARLLEELRWLRRPALSREEEALVPHALRCALSHAAPRRPVRAPDGYTYEHAALAHWLLAAGAVSPVSGRQLRGAPAPNRGVLRALRDLLRSTTPPANGPLDNPDDVL